MADSIYMRCSAAARELLANPSRRICTTGPEGIFTELDVIFRAQRGQLTWDEDQQREAQREASQVMGSLFRTGKAVRFGPVQTPEGFDYMRVATKIVYASPDGPGAIETPNGIFPRLSIEQDGITRQGRRLGANRDDLDHWSEQLELPRGVTPEQRRIVILEAENSNLRAQLADAEVEIARLRDNALTTDDIKRAVVEGLGNNRVA